MNDDDKKLTDITHRFVTMDTGVQKTRVFHVSGDMTDEEWAEAVRTEAREFLKRNKIPRCGASAAPLSYKIEVKQPRVDDGVPVWLSPSEPITPSDRKELWMQSIMHDRMFEGYVLYHPLPKEEALRELIGGQGPVNLESQTKTQTLVAPTQILAKTEDDAKTKLIVMAAQAWAKEEGQDFDDLPTDRLEIVARSFRG